MKPSLKSVILRIEDIKSAVAQVAKTHNIKKVDLFGSYADGNETKKSDVDLLVEFVDDYSVSLFDVFRAQRDFEKHLGKKVDMVCPPIPSDSFLVIQKVVPLYG